MLLKGMKKKRMTKKIRLNKHAQCSSMIPYPALAELVPRVESQDLVPSAPNRI